MLAVDMNARTCAEMFRPKIYPKLFGLIAFTALLNLIFIIVKYGFELPINKRIPSKLKRNWHNKDDIKATLSGTGLGEVGSAVIFNEYRQKLYEEYGFDAVLSDRISVNRSVPDVRPKGCMNRTFLANLPRTALIIIFHNERLSTLLRTIYSILNRTPAELIQEIILVDDGSSWLKLHSPLLNYLNRHFPPNHSKIRLIRLRNRCGLMVARMIGARVASKESEILIFLDSHFEVNYNWLPPLLEPITLNPKACTVPALDRISFETFEYTKAETVRGYFDWQLSYLIRPLSDEEASNPALNFREYIMMGGAMAIKAEFFWYLGGFDEGMLYWGGEQFEMSFKIWMCGGELLSVPCSRIGHIYRDPHTKGNTNLYGNYSFISSNFRRLVDVWLDEEHRQYVFNHRTDIKVANPGDLTQRYALHERLKCKSFSWMLEHIMSDLKRIYPPIEPGDYGQGFIQSIMHKNSCIAIDSQNKVVLAACSNGTNAENWQRFWYYTWRCELRIRDGVCLESDISNKLIRTYSCHRLGGNQKWFYDSKTKWIIQLEHKLCMVANMEKNRIELAKCRRTNVSMKWTMEFVNQTTKNECRRLTSLG